MKDDVQHPSISDQRDDLDGRIASATQKTLELGHPLPQPQQDEPNDELLLLYLDDRLDGDRKAIFERELERFPYSQQRLDIIREALGQSQQDSPPPQSAIVRLVFAFHKGVQQTLSYLRGNAAPIHVPALALRGESGDRAQKAHCFQHAFDNHEAIIQVQAITDEKIELCLELRQDGEKVRKGRATLRCDGNLIESVAFDKGAADFRGLPAGAYELELKAAGQTVGQLKLDMLPCPA
jgi:hypothetical protein